MGGDRLYDAIGAGYAVGRRTDPRIAADIHAGLGDARSVVNIGAGTGSYEPADRYVVAVEPSLIMRAQREPSSASVVAATAEALPFRQDAFDAAMAVLSDHHWSDPTRGLREMKRVARRAVLFQWDPSRFDDFWLIRDYLPEVKHLANKSLSLQQRADLLGARISTVPIPWDCKDGFFHAYWRRPSAYLDQSVRRCTSVWARVGPRIETRAVQALTQDIESGAWARRNAELLTMETADLGARLLVSAS